MTTAQHRPTPGDLAPKPPTPNPATLAPRPAAPTATPGPAPQEAPPSSRPRAMTPAEAIAPGILIGRERFKPTYTRALFLSSMLPAARLVAHTLLWHANHLSGKISPRLQPTTEQLAEATGLDPARVQVQLKILAQRGWIHLHRIEEGPRAGHPRFDLAIPALYLEQVRAARAAQAARNAAEATG